MAFYGVLSFETAETLARIAREHRPATQRSHRRGHRRGISRMPIVGVLNDVLPSLGTSTLSVLEFASHEIVAVTSSSFSVAGDVTEKLLGVSTMSAEGTTANDGAYTITSAVYSDPNTVITVAETVPDLTVDGTATWWFHPVSLHAIVAVTSYSFSVAGDVTNALRADMSVTVTGSTGNDGTYTVDSASYVDPNTIITVDETILDLTIDGMIYWHSGRSEKVRSIIPMSGSIEADKVAVAIHFGAPGYCVIAAEC